MSSQSSYRDYIPLFDVFNEAILIYDSERIHWVNNALVSLLEYDSRDELIGKNVISLIDPASKQEATNQMKRLYQGVKRTGGVYTALKRNRSQISVVSRGTQLPSADEKMLISIVRPVEEDPVDEGRVWSDFKIQHEISTSITVIKGFFEFVEKKSSTIQDPDMAKWFTRISENIEKIEKILQEVRQL